MLLGVSLTGYIIIDRIRSKPTTTDSSIEVRVTPSIAPTLIPYPTKGQFFLKLRGTQSVQIGTPFILDLYATSGKDTVAGYDVILSYDMQAIERQSVQNLVSAFRIFTYNRGNHVSISATKSIQITEPIRFNETPLLSFTFLPKTKGSYLFSLKPQGNESSKLVNEATEVSYPEVIDMRLEIK